MTRPHQLPSISHPSERHTRRISTKLTSGINMPIDLRASVVHRNQRAFIVDQIVDRPRTASRAASAAERGTLNAAAPVSGNGLSSAAAGKVDIRFGFRRRTQGSLGGQSPWN